MELKLILTAAVVAGCTLCGKAFTHAFRRRAQLLSELVDALKLVRIHVTRMLEPVERALRQSGSTLLEAVANEMSQTDGAAEAWRRLCFECCRRGGVADSLTERDLRALERLFESLGETGRMQQDAAIQSCAEALALARDEARTRRNEAEKLYTSMGALIGLAIAVIIV